MKRIITLALSALVVSGAAFAQSYQLKNASFENWENVDGGEEPAEWSSFLTATGSLAGTVKAVQLTRSDDAHAGSLAARINARNVLFGIIAQGNLTTGCINGGSMKATDAAGNYNYTRTEQAGQAMHFIGRPDSMRVWVKSETAGTMKISAILHADGYYQDPEANTDRLCKLIGKAAATPESTGGQWKCFTIPFDYKDSESPAYALVSFATNSTPGGGKEADYMIVDDIQMIYNSTLRYAVINGTRMTFDEDGKAVCTGQYDAGKVQIAAAGAGATAVTSYDEASKTLTITVKGGNVSEDATNVHTYSVKFEDGDVPEIQYPLNFPEDQAVTHAARRLHGLDFTSGKNSKHYDVDGEMAYNDLTADALEVKGGAEVRLNIDYTDTEAVHNMIWMHSYVYIDLAGDGQFDVEEEPESHFAGGDLQAFSFYSFNPDDDSEGWDSEDNYYTGDSRTNLQCPAFSVPTKPGDYRLRVKVDWNSIDPAGDLLQGIIENGGYITDLTLHVVSDEHAGEYPLNFDEDQEATNPNRRLYGITVSNEEIGESYFSVDSSYAYNDLTGEVYEAEAGSTVSVTVDYTDTEAYNNMIWMNTYVYIDLDNDGRFDVDEDTEGHTAGSDLQSFSFYSFDPFNDSEGWDSDGNYYTGDSRTNLQCPAFTLPDVPGDYRMRVKVDWNSLDPAGDDIQGIIKNGGYITDITLRILGPEGVEGQQTTDDGQQTTDYDLQGRIVKNSNKSGIILVNGKKLVR